MLPKIENLGSQLRAFINAVASNDNRRMTLSLVEADVFVLAIVRRRTSESNIVLVLDCMMRSTRTWLVLDLNAEKNAATAGMGVKRHVPYHSRRWAACFRTWHEAITRVLYTSTASGGGSRQADACDEEVCSGRPTANCCTRKRSNHSREREAATLGDLTLYRKLHRNSRMCKLIRVRTCA